ncbi:MAG: hypothetical protein ACWA42_03100 [Lutibacter sp.]
MKVFTEEQKFNQPWIQFILGIVFLVALFPILSNWNSFVLRSFEEKLSIIMGPILVLLIIILFLKIKLKTRIDEQGIYYQFFPFHLKQKFIPWGIIQKCYIRKYKALLEYGGWGMKFSYRQKFGRSFTTKGDKGLQLVLKNSKKILIGTQKEEDLKQILKTYLLKIETNEN